MFGESNHKSENVVCSTVPHKKLYMVMMPLLNPEKNDISLACLKREPLLPHRLPRRAAPRIP
jgi:hypothetical protein